MEVHTEPVNDTFFTRGCLHSASLSDGVFARVVGMTLIIPFSKPACSARWTSVSALSGVSGEGLTIMVQPAAKAVAALRRTMLS